MQKTKKLIWSGAFVAIAIAIVTLLGIAMSYAAPATAENADNANPSNEWYTVTIDMSAYSQEVQDAVNFKVNPEGYWDGKNTITMPDDTTEYKVTATETMLTIIPTSEMTKKITAEVNVKKSSGVKFISWGKFPSTSMKENITLYPVFEGGAPKDFNSVTIYGTVDDEVSNKVLEGADVNLTNKTSGETYATTHTNSEGEYTLSNLNADLFKSKDTLKNLMVVTSYPGKQIHWWDGINKEDIETIDDDGVAYLRPHTFSLPAADVNILGAEHHKNFVVDMSIYIAGKYEPSESYKFTVENVGFLNTQIPAGAEFTIDENSVFNGYSDLSEEIVENSYALLTAAPVAEDGYSFEYVQVGDNKLTNGDSFTFDGKSQYLATVFYKPVNATGIAQTGDAIPFAVLIALGIVAGLSVVAIRKFSK